VKKNPIKVFFCTYLLIGVILVFLSFWNHQKLDEGPIVFMFLFFVIGLLLGLTASILIRKPKKEPLFYLIGQLLPLVAFLSFIIYSVIKDANMSYSERNEEAIKNTSPEVKLAFEKMKSNYSLPCDFLFHTYTVFSHDSSVDFQIDTVHNIYLEYNLKNHPKITYYSKFLVYKGQATITEFQMRADSSDEYQYVEETRGDIDKTINRLEKFRDKRDDVKETIK
jgi:hypothetical protein